MSEVFTNSGESDDIIAGPSPQLQGLFIPGIDNSQFVDGFGIVTPWGGGSTTRRYRDYGIPTDISRQSTQLNDLASSLIPAEGGGLAYGIQGDRGPQGLRGLQGLPGIISVLGLNLPTNSNFLAALPHNLDLINDLGTAVDKLIYTDAYNTYTKITWTEREPAGSVSRAWEGVASDSDGSHLIACIRSSFNGRLYTSADSGVNWTERQPAGAVYRLWRGVASDSDGSHLIAAVDDGRLYTSANYGVGWTERQPAGNDDADWKGVASDDDGSHLIAGAGPGRLYTSANSGANWTERRPAGADDNLLWYSVASDSDGSHLIAAIALGRLYTSANYGVGWTERQPAGNADIYWYRVASDSDGSHLIACINGGRLYTSADYGVNWTERQPAGADDKAWQGVASDDDGSHLIAVIQNGRAYTSTDSGVTWAEEQPAGDTNRNWKIAASDSDGSHLIMGESSGNLYTGVDTELYSEATWAESDLTSAGRAILDDATAAAQATTLGLGTGDSPTMTGLTLSGLTQGSVVFAGASGVISQDNSNLFWDDTNKRLGIGINTGFDPRTGITISGDVDILHTATEADDHTFELDVDAAGYGDVKAIDIDYITGAIGLGEDEGVILINIDEIAAQTGSDVFGLEVLATEGNAGIYGMKVGAVIGPIHQNSGTFDNPAIGTNDTPQTPVANMIDGDSGPTKRTTIFVAVDDYIIIGATTAFQEIEFILTTPTSNPGIKPTFWYSTGGSGFTEFSPVDGTNGFRNTGVIAWDADDLTGHAVNADTGAANTYDIKIIRTKAGSLSPSPILGYAKIAVTTEYIWDKNGDININSLTLATVAAEGSDVDKFLVSSSGVVKYRTGAQVLSDIDGISEEDIKRYCLMLC